MKSSKKKALTVTLGAILMVVTIGITYAFINQTLTSTKKVVLTAGTLSLVLNEGNAITISDTLPMYDQVGMIQEDVFTFSLINNTANDTDYVVKLKKIDSNDELQLNDVKYYLTKDGVGTPALLSSLTDGIIDSGTIAGSNTIEYTLRLWIDSNVTDATRISGKSLSYMINIEASMTEAKGPSFVDTLIEKVDTTTIYFANISSETNGRGIYKYTEDGEDIYYWRGNIDAVATEENGIGNHVIFGGYCWKMVRTTKTGGVKMIYNGTPVESNGKQVCSNTGEASQLTSTSAFNSTKNDNAYVGYMYGLNGVSAEPSSPQCVKKNNAGTTAEIGIETTKKECVDAGGKWATNAYEMAHANVVDSTIKTVIDTWFSTSELNTEENLRKLEDAVYCNDRSIDTKAGSANGLTGYTTLGYGSNKTVYNTAVRVGYNISNPIPSLECSQENDRFTVNGNNGNGDLTYPVGLLTADEIVLAGGVYAKANSDYYLYTFQDCFTLSPYYYAGSSAYFFRVIATGDISNGYINTTRGVRPVISLAAGTTFASGTTGTETNPYIVE